MGKRLLTWVNLELKDWVLNDKLGRFHVWLYKNKNKLILSESILLKIQESTDKILVLKIHFTPYNAQACETGKILIYRNTKYMQIYPFTKV